MNYKKYKQIIREVFSETFYYLDKETRNRYIDGYIKYEEETGSLKKCLEYALEEYETNKKYKDSELTLEEFIRAEVSADSYNQYMCYPDYIWT